MHTYYVRRFSLTWILAICLCSGLAACTTNDASTNTLANPTAPATASASIATSPAHPTNILPSPTTVVTVVPVTPGIAPTIILSPTPVPGGGLHSQQVVFADRTLIINNVSRGAGTDASSVAIRLTITLKNTGAKAFTNAASYYSLFSGEGDVFGLPPQSNNSLFGSITAQRSRSGTLIFQVPLGADKALRLLYRPDVAQATVFVSLNV